MPFKGPPCKDLDAFKKSIASIPSNHQGAFDTLAKESTETICDPTALHVWESDSDLDAILQLTQVMVKIKSVSQEGGATKQGMVIVTVETPERDNFTRICELVEHLVKSEGKGHLGGSIRAFGTICVVKGVNNSLVPGANGRYEGSGQQEADAAAKRINVTIERVFKMLGSSASRKLVWHHGPTIHFLLHWINTTTPALRSALTAVTVHSAIDFANDIKPTSLGRLTKIQDLEKLEKFMKRLDIFCVFLDCGSQLITHDLLAVYVYYFAWYIHLIAPSSVLRAHLHLGLDQLITFAFRLRGACDRTYGRETVALVQEKLNGKTARKWARACISAESYTKERCRAAANDHEIHNAVKLADAPFASFHNPSTYDSFEEEGFFPAFSRLYVGPAAGSLALEAYVCAPLTLNLQSRRISASSSSPFRLYLPKPDQDVEKVTARIQGTFMAVIECLRKQSGDPALSEDEKKIWDHVKKACVWALDGCGMRLPKGVAEKVKHVEDRLGGGMWTWLLGGAPASKSQGSGGGGGQAGGQVAGGGARWG